MNLFKNKHQIETRRNPEVDEDRSKRAKGPCWRKQENVAKSEVDGQQIQTEMLPTCRMFLMEQKDMYGYPD